jgi:mannosyltransferase
VAKISGPTPNLHAGTFTQGAGATAVRPPRAWMPPSDLSRASILVLAAVLALAAALDTRFLGTRSFSMDEAFSVQLARLDWRTLPHALWSGGEMNMALYYGLLHAWLTLGDSEPIVRALSVLMAVGAVAAVFALGTRLFGARVGLLGAFLLALNAYQIRYAQEARGYSLVLLLVTLASLRFLDALARPSRRNWTVYALAGALAVYAHFFAIFVLLAHWLSAGFLVRLRAAPKGLVAGIGLTALLLAPLGLFVVTSHGGNVDWIPKPNGRTLYFLWCGLTGADAWGGCPGWRGNLLIPLYAAALGLALADGAGEYGRTPRSSAAWPYGFLLIWTVVPIGLALGLSAVKPVVITRYFIVCLPPLVLLASAGIYRLRAPWALVIFVAAFAAAAGYRDIAYYANINTTDWRGATSYVLSRSRPGDAVVLSPWYLQPPYDYYAGRASARDGPPVVSRWAASDAAGEPREAFLRGLPARYSRIWILYYSYKGPLNPRLVAALGAGSWSNADFNGVGVALYTAR